MYWLNLSLFLVLIVFSNLVSTYNILVLFPHFGKSHFDVYEPLFRTLAAKGHKIDVVSHFPQKTVIENYRDIPFNLSEKAFGSIDIFDINMFAGGSLLQQFNEVNIISSFGQVICEQTLATVEMKKLMKTKIKYDVILVEAFNSDCYLSFAYKLRLPFIALSSSGLLNWFYGRLATPNNPSYVPNLLFNHSDRMCFFERFQNTIAYIYHQIFFSLLTRFKTDPIVREHFNDPSMPSMEDVAKNCSLMLVNTHFSLHKAKPLSPNVIEVGGIHVGEDMKKGLQKNIEKWIKESKHGVIYFSMGSMIRGHTFPEEKRLAFLKAFGRLKQRVLWKWETDSMPNQPDNVMIQKWMPQFDILCHPNVKAFIGHGGLLGTTEAVHCGVPMLVMPQFGDQHTNAKALEASGGGVILNFRDVTEDSIYSALKTILTPEFNFQATELSERFRDRPMPPLDTAIYWIEYVARHKGAHHMKTAAVGMPLYQYLLLDVFAFLLAIALAFTFISYKITKFVYRKICCGDKKDKTAKGGKSNMKTKTS